MKRALQISFILILTYVRAYSAQPKLHAFFFCWTNDNRRDIGVGPTATRNLENMSSKLAFISEQINYQFKPYIVRDDNYRMQKINGVLNSTAISKDDIVIIYFSSHGTKSPNDKSIFPQVIVPIDQRLASYNVHRKISSKSPKELITIVEACSGFADITPQQNFLSEQANLIEQSAVSTPQNVLKANIRHLFGSNCNIIVSSGQPGMNTWGSKQGSIFTNAFIRALDEVLISRTINSISWDEVLNKAKNYTYQFTKATSNRHYPVWEKQKCTVNSTASEIVNSIPKTNSEFIIKSKKLNLIVLDIAEAVYKVEFRVRSNSSIDSVMYYTHYTDETPRIVKNNKEEEFAFTFNAFKEYTTKVKIYYSDGKTEEVYEKVNFN